MKSQASTQATRDLPWTRGDGPTDGRTPHGPTPLDSWRSRRDAFPTDSFPPYVGERLGGTHQPAWLAFVSMHAVCGVPRQGPSLYLSIKEGGSQSASLPASQPAGQPASQPAGRPAMQAMHAMHAVLVDGVVLVPPRPPRKRQINLPLYSYIRALKQ